MRKIMPLFLLSVSMSYAFSGPDFMLSAEQCATFGGAETSILPAAKPGLVGFVSDAGLYGISSLRWQRAGFNCDFGKLGFGVAWQQYGIAGLFDRSHLVVQAAQRFWSHLAFGVSYCLSTYDFASGVYRERRHSLGFAAGYRASNLRMVLAADGVNLWQPRAPFDDHAGFWGSAIYGVGWPLEIFLAFCRDWQDNFRAMVGETLVLASCLRVYGALMEKPRVYCVGFELVYKELRFAYTFYNMGKLHDCAKLTLGFHLEPNNS